MCKYALVQWLTLQLHGTLSPDQVPRQLASYQE